MTLTAQWAELTPLVIGTPYQNLTANTFTVTISGGTGTGALTLTSLTPAKCTVGATTTTSTNGGTEVTINEVDNGTCTLKLTKAAGSGYIPEQTITMSTPLHRIFFGATGLPSTVSNRNDFPSLLVVDGGDRKIYTNTPNNAAYSAFIDWDGGSYHYPAGTVFQNRRGQLNLTPHYTNDTYSVTHMCGTGSYRSCLIDQLNGAQGTIHWAYDSNGNYRINMSLQDGYNKDSRMDVMRSRFVSQTPSICTVGNYRGIVSSNLTVRPIAEGLCKVKFTDYKGDETLIVNKQVRKVTYYNTIHMNNDNDYDINPVEALYENNPGSFIGTTYVWDGETYRVSDFANYQNHVSIVASSGFRIMVFRTISADQIIINCSYNSTSTCWWGGASNHDPTITVNRSFRVGVQARWKWDRTVAYGDNPPTGTSVLKEATVDYYPQLTKPANPSEPTYW